MRTAWGASVLAAGLSTVVLLGHSSPVRATEWVARAAATVSGGATNNALLAPDGSPAVGSDEFTTLHAGVGGSFTGQCQGQTLGYTYGATFFAEHTQGDAQSHVLAWSLDAAPADQLSIHAGAIGTYGTLNSVNPIAANVALDPQAGNGVQFGASPTGALNYYSANATLGGTYKPKRNVLWTETTTFNNFYPTTSGELAPSYALAVNLRHEHQWAHQTLSLDLSSGYMHADSFRPKVTLPDPLAGYIRVGPYTYFPLPIAEVSTIPVQLMAGWRHDFNPLLSASAEAGALALHSFVTGVTNYGPAARAVASYQNLISFADLTLAHQPQLNVFIGQTFVSDNVMLRAVMFLDRAQRFRFVAFASAQHNSVLGSAGLSSAIDLLSVDVGVAYHPTAYPVQASLEYTGLDQIGHRVGTSNYPDVHRQMVLLTVSAAIGTNAPWGVAGAGELAPTPTLH
jgi:hypothetical protein